MQHWVEGINSILRTFQSLPDASSLNLRLTRDLESTQNRINDLLLENRKLIKALSHVSSQLGISTVDIFQAAEEGRPLPTTASSLLSPPPPSSSDSTEESKEKGKVREPLEREDSRSFTIDFPPETPHFESAIMLDQSLNSERRMESLSDHLLELDSDSEDEVDDPTEGLVEGSLEAEVIYEYVARKQYELTITAGERLSVLSKHSNGWWHGRNQRGDQGYFPGSYVKTI